MGGERQRPAHALRDAGKTWTAVSTGGSEPLTKVSADGADGVWAGGEGTLLHSADSGAGWTRFALGASHGVNRIVSAGPNTAWCIMVHDVGGSWSYEVVGTSNAGQTWTTQLATTTVINDIACSSPTNAWAVGDGNSTGTPATARLGPHSLPPSKRTRPSAASPRPTRRRGR